MVHYDAYHSHAQMAAHHPVQALVVRSLAQMPVDVASEVRLIDCGCLAPLIAIVREARLRRLVSYSDGEHSAELFLSVIRCLPGGVCLFYFFYRSFLSL